MPMPASLASFCRFDFCPCTQSHHAVIAQGLHSGVAPTATSQRHCAATLRITNKYLSPIKLGLLAESRCRVRLRAETKRLRCYCCTVDSEDMHNTMASRSIGQPRSRKPVFEPDELLALDFVLALHGVVDDADDKLLLFPDWLPQSQHGIPRGMVSRTAYDRAHGLASIIHTECASGTSSHARAHLDTMALAKCKHCKTIERHTTHRIERAEAG